MVSHVHTVEVSDGFFNEAQRYLSDCKNLVMHKGDSSKILPNIIEKVREQQGDSMVLFYLDAYWGNFWPLHDELDIIGKYFKDTCIVIIDDFAVPGKSYLSYDSYHGIKNDI